MTQIDLCGLIGSSGLLWAFGDCGMTPHCGLYDDCLWTVGDFCTELNPTLAVRRRAEFEHEFEWVGMVGMGLGRHTAITDFTEFTSLFCRLRREVKPPVSVHLLMTFGVCLSPSAPRRSTEVVEGYSSCTPRRTHRRPGRPIRPFRCSAC